MQGLPLVDLMADVTGSDSPWSSRVPPGPPLGSPPPLDPRAPGARQWWASMPDAAPSQAQQNIGQTSTWTPPKVTLTTLGWLKYLDDPSFQHFEWHYLKFLHKCLTTKWYTIQFGVDDEALNLWYLVFKVLELDQKAQLDLMLLVQSGHIGRGHANQLMWDLMAYWALDDTYEDLSHKVSNQVGWARKAFDRPPVGHRDAEWWSWKAYDVPTKQMEPWCPTKRPQGSWDLRMGVDGEPFPPPWCWGDAHQ